MLSIDWVNNFASQDSPNQHQVDPEVYGVAMVDHNGRPA